MRATIVLVLLLSSTNAVWPQPNETDKQVKKLIDQLTELDRQDLGYSGSTSGSSFLPLGKSEFHSGMLFQTPNRSSDTLKSLVKLGTKALPLLIEHLTDERATRIELTHNMPLGGMFVNEDEVYAKQREKARKGFERKYTVMVGDLCYVAIGQIVNSGYSAVRYQPTAIIMINSAPHCKKLRDEVIKEWSNLTPEKHRDSLLKDLESSHEYLRNSASIRLAYYYPEALEAAALKQLSKPTYDVYKVHDLVREQLYPAKTPQQRKTIVEDFTKKYGDVSRQAVLWNLFDDLDTQEADEEGRVSPKLNPRYRARECLIEIFGLPATVKSTDRPKFEPLSETAQARFVQTLIYDYSEKLDIALRDILAKTDEEYLAEGCLNRLAGRGYDDVIEAYLKRRLPKADEHEKKKLEVYRAKLGWTRIHVAVDRDMPESVEKAIQDRVDVNKPGRDGRTALHMAASEGKTQCASLLLKAKADPNIKDSKGRQAIELAAAECHYDIAQMIVKYGGSINDLFVATAIGDKNQLLKFLKDKPNAVQQRDAKGYQPLHIAAMQGHVDIVQILLKNGADLKELDDPKRDQLSCQGWNALHLAAMNSQTQVAELLIASGANVNFTSKLGLHTALHFAASNGNAELVTLLLKHKADPKLTDRQNRSALDLAKSNQHTAVVKLLEQAK